MTECVNRLIAKPPQSRREASTLFGYFSSRLGELGQNSVNKVADARIVPVASHQQSPNRYTDEKASTRVDLRHLTPRQCYLGSSSTYDDVFEFVDFGNDANAFLLKCGSKNEPTILEVAALACKEPARLLTIMQSPERYLSMLRTLATELSQLKRDKLLFKQMKQSPFLLCTKEISVEKQKRNSRKSDTLGGEYDSDPEEMEDAPIREFQLSIPGNIVIVSNFIASKISLD